MKSHQLSLGLFGPEKQQRDDRLFGAQLDIAAPGKMSKAARPKSTPIFRTYWEFAAKRQSIFFARLAGNQSYQPYDPILSRYRFTNTFRASDRVSQYLIRNVIYSDRWEPEDLFFRIMVFKFFNKIDTWEALEAALGEVSWRSYRYKDYDHVLTSRLANGEKVYSGAYIMASGKSQIGNDRKHQNHLRVIEMMMTDRIPDRISQQTSFESVYRLLRCYPCIGPFVGYQFAIDLNYSSLVQFSENDFVEAGPGAMDGLRKCFSDFGDYTPNDVIRYMTDIQEEAFSSFGIEFEDLWGRKLHLIDCQNVFCEIDKYARVAYPDVVGSSGRTRIKQIYSRSKQGLPSPFYPPRWNINHRIDRMLNSHK